MRANPRSGRAQVPSRDQGGARSTSVTFPRKRLVQNFRGNALCCPERSSEEDQREPGQGCGRPARPTRYLQPGNAAQAGRALGETARRPGGDRLLDVLARKAFNPGRDSQNLTCAEIGGHAPASRPTPRAGLRCQGRDLRPRRQVLDPPRLPGAFLMRASRPASWRIHRWPTCLARCHAGRRRLPPPVCDRSWPDPPPQARIPCPGTVREPDVAAGAPGQRARRRQVARGGQVHQDQTAGSRQHPAWANPARRLV